MSKFIGVNASILCADFSRLEQEIKKCEAAGVDKLHVDVMDGHFVPNITIGPVIVETLRRLTRLPIESHLMIENPGRYIDDFMNAGSDIISVQAECYGERTAQSRSNGQFPKVLESFDKDLALADIKRIQAKGKKAFLVVNPQTPLLFDSILNTLDGVLIMSVNPGFAKQKFMPEVLDKVRDLRKKFDGDIEIDGGVNEQTAPEIIKAGVNWLVSASYFFGARDQQAVVKYLKSLS